MSDYDPDSWAISDQMFAYMKRVLPEGKTILELGSGEGTLQLLKHWEVISVEHDPEYVEKLTNRCIYAPLTEHKAIRNHSGVMKWYDRDILKPELEGLEYDLLLVDGPPNVYRCGVVKYIDLFNTDAILVFDDLQRKEDKAIINSIAAKLKKPFVTYSHLGGKPFGVINDPHYREKL
jgi:predicted O-methyltransferase YrrM